MHNQNGCQSTGCSCRHGAIHARKGDLGNDDSSGAFNESWGSKWQWVDTHVTPYKLQ